MNLSDKPSFLLPLRNAGDEEVQQAWGGTNEQWWNWYMSLAENTPAPPTVFPASKASTPALSPLSATEFTASLSEPYPLTDEQRHAFRTQGYVKLKNVLPPAVLAALRVELLRKLMDVVGNALTLQFRSLELLWLQSQLLRQFTLSPRLGRLAAELLGVESVRLYHDNGLVKESGCGRTPWHYDAHHFPIDSQNVCTVWVPLQNTPREMGPLAFAMGIDRYKLARDVSFSKFDASYDRQVSERFASHGVEIDDGPFDLGEVSFHHVLNFHTAGPNLTPDARAVLATTYFDDGARVVSAPTMISGDWQKFMPGVNPGERIGSALNPVCFPAPPVERRGLRYLRYLRYRDSFTANRGRIGTAPGVVKKIKSVC